MQDAAQPCQPSFSYNVTRLLVVLPATISSSPSSGIWLRDGLSFNTLFPLSGSFFLLSVQLNCSHDLRLLFIVVGFRMIISYTEATIAGLKEWDTQFPAPRTIKQCNIFCAQYASTSFQKKGGKEKREWNKKRPSNLCLLGGKNETPVALSQQGIIGSCCKSRLEMLQINVMRNTIFLKNIVSFFQELPQQTILLLIICLDFFFFFTFKESRKD